MSRAVGPLALRIKGPEERAQEGLRMILTLVGRLANFVPHILHPCYVAFLRFLRRIFIQLGSTKKNVFCVTARVLAINNVCHNQPLEADAVVAPCCSVVRSGKSWFTVCSLRTLLCMLDVYGIFDRTLR